MKASDKYPTPPTVGASVIVPVDTFEAMKREIDQLSPKEPEKVWPQGGELINYVDHAGDIQMHSFKPDSAYHKYLIASGRAAPTDREAIIAHRWLTSPITQARRRIEGLDGFNPVGEGCIQSFSSEAATVVITVKGDFKNGGIRFTTTEQAEAALSTHEADIRLVLTGES